MATDQKERSCLEQSTVIKFLVAEKSKLYEICRRMSDVLLKKHRRGVIVKSLGCGIEVREFEFQSS